MQNNGAKDNQTDPNCSMDPLLSFISEAGRNRLSLMLLIDFPSIHEIPSSNFEGDDLVDQSQYKLFRTNPILMFEGNL